jgi:hypothetical protein
MVRVQVNAINELIDFDKELVRQSAKGMRSGSLFPLLQMAFMTDQMIHRI